MSVDSAHLAKAYRAACMAELQALKPGNVHVFSDGHGMTIHDFIKSADVTAEVITQTALTLGARVYFSVEATQQAVGQNTNLGVVLLCAPLIHAALHQLPAQPFIQSLYIVLAQLTCEDAQCVANAIQLANPAGLGVSAIHDVREKQTATLLDVMRTAQDTDSIAWQYANSYQDVLLFGVARYTEAMHKWKNSAWATTAVYLGFLSRSMDSHVKRKYGETIADGLMKEALEFEQMHWSADNPKLVQKHLLAWDASLKQRSINPGTSADLTVATLLAHCLV